MSSSSTASARAPTSSSSPAGTSPVSSSTAPSKPAAVENHQEEGLLYDPVAVITDDGMKVYNRSLSPIPVARNPFSVLFELDDSSKEEKKKKKKRNRTKKKLEGHPQVYS